VTEERLKILPWEGVMAHTEPSVVVEERGVVDDLSKLDLSGFVVTNQLRHAEIRLKHELEMNKTQALYRQEEERKDAETKREKELKDGEAQRDQGKHRHWLEIGKDIVTTLSFIVIAFIILLYTGQRINDPSASIEEKKIAYGIWGTAIGAVAGYLAGKRSQASR
jgi:hypothetical protein